MKISIAFLLLTATIALSGCTGCEPLLEVRNCLDHQCVPSDDAVEMDWNQDLAEAWPELTAAMQGTELGEHHHATWTRDQEQSLWDAFGVEGDQPELIIQYEDERFRVRVLTCD